MKRLFVPTQYAGEAMPARTAFLTAGSGLRSAVTSLKWHQRESTLAGERQQAESVDGGHSTIRECPGRAVRWRDRSQTLHYRFLATDAGNGYLQTTHNPVSHFRHSHCRIICNDCRDKESRQMPREFHHVSEMASSDRACRGTKLVPRCSECVANFPRQR